MKNEQTQCVLHGECLLFPSTLPEGAVKIKTTNDQFHIVADSETTGNHHVIDINDSVNFYNAGGVTYMVNTKPTKIRCVLQDRHSPIDLEPGVWECGTQLEYDYFAQNLRAVRD